MKLYLIEHSNPEFTGFSGGVDFWRGRGTTGSRDDAERLANLGHRVSALEAGTAKQGTTTREAAEAASPVDFTPTPEEAAAGAQTEADRKALDKEERNPDSEWSRKRAARAREKAGSRRRRR